VRVMRYPFQMTSLGMVNESSDYAQVVRGQIIDALMTNMGERVFRPRYGCDIQAMLFDPSDELNRTDAAGQIKRRLEQLVPRAIIRSVTFTPYDPEPGYVTINVVYRPALYATDVVIAVPVASEFYTRQQVIPIGEI
jgi:uncharacterized protein